MAAYINPTGEMLLYVFSFLLLCLQVLCLHRLPVSRDSSRRLTHRPDDTMEPQEVLALQSTFSSQSLPQIMVDTFLYHLASHFPESVTSRPEPGTGFGLRSVTAYLHAHPT